MSAPLEISFLAALQGLTEFLPVSSSGHLALAQMLFGVEEGSLTLNVLLHAGTLLATLIYFRARLMLVLRDSFAHLSSPTRLVTSEGGGDAVFVVIASIPTGIIGLLAHDLVGELTRSPLATGLGFLGTTVILLVTRWAPTATVTAPGWKTALLIGVCQGIAVLPGVSRSGMTIAAAMLLGVRVERAFELSMLMSIPAIVGAVALELRGALSLNDGILGLLIGVSVSAIVGTLALSLLRRVVTAGRLPLFALWVAPLGVATLALARAWPG